MKNFSSSVVVLAASAILAAKAQTVIDCVADTQTSIDPIDNVTVLPPRIPISQADCEALPDWAASFLDDGANFLWTRV